MRIRLEELLRKPWFYHVLAACTAVVLYLALSHIYYVGIVLNFISPLIWGFAIAYLMNPLIMDLDRNLPKKIKNDKARYGIAVILSILIVLAVVSLLFVLLIPSMVRSISGIIDNVEYYGSNLETYLNNFGKFASRFNINVSKMMETGESMIKTAVEYVTNNADKIAGTFFDVGKGIVNISIGFVIAVYFMFDKKNLVKNFNGMRKLLMKDETFENHNVFWRKCHEILSRFILFDVIDGIIIGIANMIFMFIFQMPNVALISVIIGVTNIIPTFGPIIGAIIGAIILVLTSPMNALLFIIFTIVIQTIDASILKPKLFGNSFGVPSVWIFVAIVLGGKLFGVIGILLAIPFAAIVTFSLNEIVIPRLEERKKRIEKEEKKYQ